MNLYAVYRSGCPFRPIFTLLILGEMQSIAPYTKHCVESRVGEAFRKYPGVNRALYFLLSDVTAGPVEGTVYFLVLFSFFRR